MKEYTYLPEVRQAFRCSVPNAGIRQVFMVDGLLQEPSGMENGWELMPGKDGKGGYDFWGCSGWPECDGKDERLK